MGHRHWPLWIGGALLIGGAVILGWCGWVWHQASVARQQARQWLEHPPNFQAIRPPRLPQARGPRRGAVLGELEIPRLHVSVVVLEGDDSRVLNLGAGHIPGTALPSSDGNVGIAAHRDRFFRPLRLIRPRDVITLRTPAGTSRYSVDDIEIVRPSDTQVLAPGPGRNLTLVTCYPFYYIGHAPKRFIVHAKLEAAPPAPGKPS